LPRPTTPVPARRAQPFDSILTSIPVRLRSIGLRRCIFGNVCGDLIRFLIQLEFFQLEIHWHRATREMEIQTKKEETKRPGRYVSRAIVLLSRFRVIYNNGAHVRCPGSGLGRFPKKRARSSLSVESLRQRTVATCRLTGAHTRASLFHTDAHEFVLLLYTCHTSTGVCVTIPPWRKAASPWLQSSLESFPSTMKTTFVNRDFHGASAVHLSNKDRITLAKWRYMQGKERRDRSVLIVL